jgi:hypothetical protein
MQQIALRRESITGMRRESISMKRESITARRESVWVEAEAEAMLPLALRLRCAWSCDNIWDLRKSCEDDMVSCSDCSSPAGASDCTKFIDDDSASTCDGDDASLVSDETGVEDSSDSMPTRLDWAEEMYEPEVPRSQEMPPGVLAPPGQWMGASGPISGPPGQLLGVFGTISVPQAMGDFSGYVDKADLVKSVKDIQRSEPEVWFGYTAEHGNNLRDPKKHTVKFLKAFLRQYNSR